MHRPLLVLLLSAAAHAQNHTAYPIDDLHGTFGHWAPFGILSTGNADECRVHYLIPAPYLAPGAGQITGIEVSPHVVGTVPYERLIIRLGLTPVATLSGIFANNAAVFTTVFSQAGFSVNWASRTQWYPLTFATPFAWDGVSNLVIEIEKVVDRPNNPTLPTISHQNTSAPRRDDLPLPIFREGAYGSGAATAPTGSVYNGGTMLIRLQWAADPVQNITSTRASGRSYFHLGSTVTVSVQGQSSELFLVLLDTSLTTGAPIPPVTGLYWLPGFLVLGSGALDASGAGGLSVTMPSNQRLVNAHLYFQTVVGSLSRLVFTNVVDGIVAQ
jgi:hypothetical protein